jgi:hypothetical protein
VTGCGKTGSVNTGRDLRRARDAGCDDHLVKPVDFETLSRCLAGLPGGAFSRRVS